MVQLFLFGDVEDRLQLSEVGIGLVSLQCNPEGMKSTLAFTVDDKKKFDREVQKQRLIGFIEEVYDGKEIDIEYNPDARSDWSRYRASFKSALIAVPKSSRAKSGNYEPF